MKYQLPERLKELVAYAPIMGEYQIRLDANESFLGLSDRHLSQIAQEMRSLAYNRYPDPYADRLCEAFSQYYGVKRELVTASNGSDELIALICGTLFQKGDKLAVFEYDFSMYKLYAQMYDVDCEVLPKEDNLEIDVDQAIKLINQKGIAAVLFSNPCNPTSLGLSREDVIRLVEGVEALVILDEAYMDFWDQSLLGQVEEYENLIILRTCSKAVGMAGIRVGFAVAPASLTQVLRVVKSPYNVNAFSQMCGAVMLEDQGYLHNATDQLLDNRQTLYYGMLDLLQKYDEVEKIFDSVTNFILVKTTCSKRIYEELLQTSIAVRLMGPCLRISAGSTEENSFLLQQLEEILKSFSA